eukprot:3795723-Prorocentrum_lima.AAC.1
MTSSLVGSEMCIRDRLNVMTVNFEMARDFPLSSNLEARDFFNAVSAAIAVSYTHLTLPTICSV